MFHLTTHAFFKALLFLGAGSVIHALHHEQDIWKMGHLRKHMPVTYWTFLIGTLALCGVPPFSGFYSKDAVLAQAYAHDKALFVIAALVAVLTTFYMFRLFFVAFEGKPRSEASEHAHESPGVMTWPLRILAVLSVVGGVIGIDHFINQSFPKLVEEHEAAGLNVFFAPFGHSPLAAIFGLFAIVVGVTAAYVLYAGAEYDRLPEALGNFSRAMRDRFYFDELYDAIVNVTQEMLARVAGAFDSWIVSGLVRLVHGSTELAGRALRLAQTGNVQAYAFMFVMGAAIILFFVLVHF
jgi:NADH-quinone oxidoreductase subunit L